MRKAAVVAFISVVTVFPANASSILFESATLGTPCSLCGSGVTATQFIGARFHVDSTVQIDAVGGSLFVFSPGLTLFGAIVSLDSMDALPSNSPFSFVPLAVTLLDPGTISSDVKANLTLTLGPGEYGLIFGAGRFGATIGPIGGLADTGSPIGNPSFFFSNFDNWFNAGTPPGERFVVYGEAAAIPEPYSLLLFGTALGTITVRLPTARWHKKRIGLLFLGRFEKHI